MIYMNLKLSPPVNRTSEVLHAIRLHMGPTQVQPGCILCKLSQDTQNPSTIHYQEAWKCWEELEKHIRSNRFSRILELMEISTSTPDLSFSDVQESRGIEYVKRLRMVNHN